MAYEWKQNIACVSAYKILANLHQLNPSKVTFEKAAALKLKQLAYYPASSSEADFLRTSASMLTTQYSQLLSQNYILRAQATATWKQVMAAIFAVLLDGDKTVANLAEAIDTLIRFEDE